MFQVFEFCILPFVDTLSLKLFQGYNGNIGNIYIKDIIFCPAKVNRNIFPLS